MITCPNTGRKPWFCNCPEHVAMRLGPMPEPPLTTFADLTTKVSETFADLSKALAKKMIVEAIKETVPLSRPRLPMPPCGPRRSGMCLTAIEYNPGEQCYTFTFSDGPRCEKMEINEEVFPPSHIPAYARDMIPKNLRDYTPIKLEILPPDGRGHLILAKGFMRTSICLNPGDLHPNLPRAMIEHSCSRPIARRAFRPILDDTWAVPLPEDRGMMGRIFDDLVRPPKELLASGKKELLVGNKELFMGKLSPMAEPKHVTFNFNGKTVALHKEGPGIIATIDGRNVKLC